jgi:hypothetical protein
VQETEAPEGHPDEGRQSAAHPPRISQTGAGHALAAGAVLTSTKSCSEADTQRVATDTLPSMPASQVHDTAAEPARNTAAHAVASASLADAGAPKAGEPAEPSAAAAAALTAGPPSSIAAFSGGWRSKKKAAPEKHLPLRVEAPGNMLTRAAALLTFQAVTSC